MRRVAKQTGVDFVAAEGRRCTTGAYALRKPRIAMYQRYGGGNMDEGWTRLMFEQFSVPFKTLMDAEIEGRRPRTQVRHDHPAGRFGRGDDWRASGRRRRGGGGGGGGFGGGAGQHAARISSGFGADGVKALQAFVQKGGTL